MRIYTSDFIRQCASPSGLTWPRSGQVKQHYVLENRKEVDVIMALFYLENKPHAKSRNGGHITTQYHYDYICREGRYETIGRKQEDLVYERSGNLPDWANSAREFWVEAEKHRRANGRAYREIKLALQEEFTLAENVQLVEEFCRKFGITTNHVFSYVIHDKSASFDPKHRNIHAHIMFNEKLIDPNRQLSADQYFCQYREDRNGMPTSGSGYMNDPYFKTKDCTVAMRKMWAKIVNEKFEEKGMNIRISEKTLKAQHDELVAQGKEDEAEYYDREPAPHLGKAYRNDKKLERLRDIQDEMDFDSDVDPNDDTDDEAEEKENLEKMEKASIEERKMLIFAADALIRRVAKELQEERRKAKEEEKARAEEELEESALAPVVVTVCDVTNAMFEKARAAEQEQKRMEALIKETRKGILKDAVLYNAAKEKVVPGWHASKMAYERSKVALANLKKAAYDDYHAPLERADLINQYDSAYSQHKGIEMKYSLMENQVEKEKAKIQEVFNESKSVRAGLEKQAKDLYRRKMIAQREHDMYYDKAKYLMENVPEDKILFSEPLPKLVDRTLKVNGYRSMKRMPLLKYKEASYYILDDMRVMDKESDFIYTAKALRDGDSVIQGKANLYDVRVQYQNIVLESGHTVRRPVILSCKKAQEQARFYQVHNDNRGYLSSGRASQNKLPMMQQRQGIVSEITNKLVETNKAMPKAKLVSLNDKQNEVRTRPKTEYEMAEEELERFGRSLSL